jgi:hypothetical protein
VQLTALVPFRRAASLQANRLVYPNGPNGGVNPAARRVIAHNADVKQAKGESKRRA